MTQYSYTIFQTDPDAEVPASSRTSHLQRLGFLGKVLEGTAVLMITLFITFVTLTSAARAQDMLTQATHEHSTLLALALASMFAALLVMVRRTWRHTNQGIAQAPRRSHRIG